MEHGLRHLSPTAAEPDASDGDYVTITDLHPLIIQVSPVKASVAGVERSFAEADAVYAMGGRIAWLSCLPAGMKINSEANSRAAELIKERREVIKRQAVGIAFQSDSRFLSFILSTLLLTQPMHMPYKAGSDMFELLAWLDVMLKKTGLGLPADTPQRVPGLIARARNLPLR